MPEKDKVDEDAYLKVDEYMQDGEPVDVAEQAQWEASEGSRKTVLDLDAIREQEAWSDLADKVVGAEGI